MTASQDRRRDVRTRGRVAMKFSRASDEYMRDKRMAGQINSDEDDLDAASARRVMAVLRREQAARDGRQLGRAWGRLADRVQRDYPTS
ncbi:MAG TPA: hypothetical protein VMY78_13405 [Solirubrobacteraceae bacterium]|nr:hypothetical protein [Solirubrobacteraceae bacterium]